MDSTVRPSVIVRSDGKREVSLVLDEVNLAWLQEMTRKYELPSVGKALRIVILYARQQEKHHPIFDKATGNLGKAGNTVTEVYMLDKEHDDYLDQAVSHNQLVDKSKAVRIILDFAISRKDGDNIFEVKRCKHASTCGCAHG